MSLLAAIPLPSATESDRTQGLQARVLIVASVSTGRPAGDLPIRPIPDSQDNTTRIRPATSKIGTIVPGKIVPVDVPSRHGLERGVGDQSASRTACSRPDAGRASRPGWSERTLPRLDRTSRRLRELNRAQSTCTGSFDFALRSYSPAPAKADEELLRE